MDKNKFIEIYVNICNNKVTTQDIMSLYTEYCKVFKKPELAIEDFIHRLLAFNLINDTIEYPISYYKKEFNICTITNKNGNIIKVF